MHEQTSPPVVRSPSFPKHLWREADGRRIAGIYVAEDDRAVVIVPMEATRWEERTAARLLTEKAAETGSSYEVVFLDELPPVPQVLGVN